MHVKQFGNQRKLCHFECKKYKSCKSLPLVRCRTEANLLLILLCWVGVGLLMCKQGYPMSVLSRLYSRGGVAGFQIPTMCVVPVSTLGVGEDSEQSFQHQRERAGQQGPEDGGQGSAWGGQGPLGGGDDCPHGLAEVTRPQYNRGDIQLQFNAAAVDLGVAAT